MKTFLGILTLVLAVPSYTHYLHGVFTRRTVPHMYSWLIWAILAGISYIAQVKAHAGPGAWNTGFTAIVCFVVFIIAIRYGERRLSSLDVLLLIMAFFAIVALLLIENSVAAVLLTTIAASIGFTLTIKKAYYNPYQEDRTTFSINSLRNLVSLFALNSVSFVTLFYPFCMMITNFAVVAAILMGKTKQK